MFKNPRKDKANSTPKSLGLERADYGELAAFRAVTGWRNYCKFLADKLTGFHDLYFTMRQVGARTGGFTHYHGRALSGLRDHGSRIGI